MARAITSLPVPVSPTSRTALSTGATMPIASVTARNAALLPISGPAMAILQHDPSVAARHPGDVFQQLAGIERFHQESNGAISQSLLPNHVVVMGRDDDDRQLTSFSSNPPLQFGAVDTGQAHVGDDARHAREHTGKDKGLRGCKADGLVAGGFEDALNRLPNPTIVV